MRKRTRPFVRPSFEIFVKIKAWTHGYGKGCHINNIVPALGLTFELTNYEVLPIVVYHIHGFFKRRIPLSQP